MMEAKNTRYPWKADPYMPTIWGEDENMRICDMRGWGRLTGGGFGGLGLTDKEAEVIQIANRDLIVAAVNTCMQINPSNPVAVAEALPLLYRVCDYLAAMLDLAKSEGRQKCELDLNGTAAESIFTALAKARKGAE